MSEIAAAVLSKPGLEGYIFDFTGDRAGGAGRDPGGCYKAGLLPAATQ